MTTQQSHHAPQPMPRARSGGLTAVGILSIVYAVVFHLCGSIFGLSFPLWGPAFFRFIEDNVPDAPPLGALFEGPMMWFSVISSLAMLILGVCFLAGGIGLLKLRPWGRKLSLAVSVATIVWTIMAFLISQIFVAPLVYDAMEHSTQHGSHIVGQIFGAVIGVAFRLAFPIILLVFLTRPAFAEQFEPPPGHPSET